MTIDREELRRLCEAATPGPWRACKDGACDCRMIWSRAVDCVVAVGIAAKDEQYTSGEGIVDARILTANAAFIAAARAAVPALLDALEAAEARERSIRALLSKVAAIAHCGGLADLDTFSALIEIRKLTLSAWDNSSSVQEQRNRVLLALAETAP